ncbi:MAG: Na/Pi cotransporter family protein [Proteocatella sp.]
MYFTIFLEVVAGLGLFLYGMNLMGSGLQKAAGEKLKSIIGLLTKNRFVAVFVGIFVTAIIQSSSATTVMVVGFVNAGIMQLSQAIGIIMGANVGTTVTAQLVSFNLEKVAPVAVGIGMLMLIVKKNTKSKNYADILIGFGILFVGMIYMKDAVKPLREVQAFKDALVTFGSNPFLGILIGFGITLLLQSSSASIGILLALSAQGLLPLSSALPILYGDNIGTCTTALISSIGASKNAQRAAVMHLTFNIIGTLLFALVLHVPITYVVTLMDPTDVTRQIANAHSLFNVVNVIIQFPIAGFIVKFAETVIPSSKEEVLGGMVTHLDKRMLGTPSIALESVFKECINMGIVAKDNVQRAVDGFIEKDIDKVDAVFLYEKDINKMEREIIDYLISLSNSEISLEDRIIVDGLFNTVNDIERIGDHAENIAELAQNSIENNLPFSSESKDELLDMVDKVIYAVQSSLDAMRTGDIEIAERVRDLEEKVDAMEKSCRAGHIYRLNNSMCNPESGIMFLDVISNLERISDHATNIADAVVNSIV